VGPRFEIGEAISYGFKKFQENAAVLIGIMLVVAIGFVATGIVAFAARFSGASGLLVRNMIIGILFSVAVGALQLGLYRATLAITAGQPVDFASMYSSENLGPYLTTILIITVLTAVGDLLCFVPGLIVRFYTYFAPFYVLDQQMSPGDALRASVQITQANLGLMIPFAIVAALLYLVGFLLCGIGVLATAPIALIAVAFAYRRLNGEPVAA
jgi:uncharacterized membrane protein